MDEGKQEGMRVNRGDESQQESTMGGRGPGSTRGTRGLSH